MNEFSEQSQNQVRSFSHVCWRQRFLGTDIVTYKLVFKNLPISIILTPVSAYMLISSVCAQMSLQTVLSPHILQLYLCRTLDMICSLELPLTSTNYWNKLKIPHRNALLLKLKRGSTKNSKPLTSYSFVYKTSCLFYFCPKLFPTFPAAFLDQN